MLKKFRTYQLSVKFYQSVTTIKLPSHLKDQMNRASSSICLNLAEGSGKRTAKDKMKYYSISLGSLRECYSQEVMYAGMSRSDCLSGHI